MRRRKWERGWVTLIELLVAICIIGVLAWLLLGRGTRRPEGIMTTPRAAIERGRDVECMANLRSIRQAMQLWRAGEGGFPSSLKDLSNFGITDKMTKCPVGGENYLYDPNTGKVKCPHPGHGNY